MLGEEASLQIILRARDEASAVLGEAEGSLGGVAKAAAGLALVGGAALVAIAAHSVKMASDFQTAVNLIHTQAGAWDEDLQKIQASLLALAPAVGMGPTQLAEGLYHVESAGFRGAKAIDMLTQAAKLAQIGQADFESTTQAVIGVMAAYEGKNVTAAQAAAQLNAIVGSGDMRMQQLAKAISTGILPTAATFGLSLKDVGAALATLTDNVTPADEAATRLRMTFSMMGAPTGAAQKALHAIGLDATTLANDMRQPNGLLVAVGDLRNHLAKIDVSHFKGGVAEARAELMHFGLSSGEANAALSKLGPSATEQAVILARAFGGGRSSAAIMTLITEFDRLKQKYHDIGQGANDFGRAWETTQKNFSFQMSQLRAAADAAQISIGLKLLPALSSLIQRIMPAIPTIANLAGALGTVLVNALLLLVNIIGTTITVIGNVINWIRQWHVLLLALATLITAIMLPTLIALTVQGVRSLTETIILQTMYLVENTAAFVKNIAQLVIANVTIIAQTAAKVATTAATIAWTAAQWLLNAAMFAFGGPVGLIIVAIAALAAGIIYAYTHVGWFHNAVNVAAAAVGGLVGWIGNAIGAFVRFITPVAQAIAHTQGLQAILMVLLGPIGLVILAMTHLGDIINAIGGFIRNVTGAVGGLANALGNIHVPNISLPHIPGFQAGGVIPGATGTPHLVVAHGGEGVFTPSQMAALGAGAGARGGGDQTIILQVDGREMAKVVFRHGQQMRRLKGGWLGTGA